MGVGMGAGGRLEMSGRGGPGGDWCGGVVVGNNYPQQLPGRVVVGTTTTPTTTRNNYPKLCTGRGPGVKNRLGCSGSCVY